jgi:hypothetical protein
MDISDISICTFAAREWTATNEQFNRGTPKNTALSR